MVKILTFLKSLHENKQAESFSSLSIIFDTSIQLKCILSHVSLIISGGNDKAIELGVISLGTTTTDGNRREVKVEVLGVLERGTGRIRLRATEPIAGKFLSITVWLRMVIRIYQLAGFVKYLNIFGYGNKFEICPSPQI